jgi:hypothetical protein
VVLSQFSEVFEILKIIFGPFSAGLLSGLKPDLGWISQKIACFSAS